MNSGHTESVGAHVFVEFLEVAIHSIIYLRRLYPETVFLPKKKYGVAVFQVVHPEVHQYILHCLKAVAFHVSKKQLRKVIVCFENEETVSDKFVFNILAIADSCNSDIFLVELETCFRTFLLKLHSAQLHLDEIVSGKATFSVRLETTNISSIEFNSDPSFEHFLWIPQSLNEDLHEDAASIVPVYSFEIACFKLETYIVK